MNSDLSADLMHNILLLYERFFYCLHGTDEVSFIVSYEVNLSKVAFSQKFYLLKIWTTKILRTRHIQGLFWWHKIKMTDWFLVIKNKRLSEISHILKGFPGTMIILFVRVSFNFRQKIVYCFTLRLSIKLWNRINLIPSIEKLILM